MRETARQTFDKVGEVPPVLRNRTLSPRAYNAAGMMIDADIVDGDTAEAALERFLTIEAASYLHIHNAKRGCFSCIVERA